MEKRYQVFISSTFADLKDERQSVLRAILELDHMPAGMELFPAADDSAWQLIRDVIDASDYYVVIVGGRYGSLDEKGIGYTEKEYDYALETGKPVLALLHQKPDLLPREKTETEAEAWKKLQAFRAKVEKRHTCVYWTNAEDLKAKVIIGITTAVKRTPGVGWVRADQVPAKSTLADVLALRNRISELEEQIATDASRPPSGTQDLVQGDEEFGVGFSFTARDADDSYPYTTAEEFVDAFNEVTWNGMFAAVAPMMMHEAEESALRAALKSYWWQEAVAMLRRLKAHKTKTLFNPKFRENEVETVIVQFRALGLIEQSQRPRSVRNIRTYWRLTKHGDNLMTKLRAVHRTTDADSAAPSGTLKKKSRR
jgi:hypothetical protein